jgi:hypothetical protein
MAKARLENNKVRVYMTNPKPFIIIENYENGFTPGVSYWGGDALTEEEWQSFGFFPYDPPQINNRIQTITSIVFDETEKVYKAVVDDISWDITLDEHKSILINNLKEYYNNELQKTDWIILRNIETGIQTDSSITSSRALLREECAIKEQKIINLTSHQEVAMYDI